MSVRHAFLIAALMLGFFTAASSTQAGFAVLPQSVAVDQADGTATFTIDFPHAPDFFTLDTYNRQADSFQIQIASPGGNPIIAPSVIVRGEEIHFGKGVPIRNATPSVSDPGSGGWGSVRGTVPFTVMGDSLSFTAPLTTLGAPTGKFSYLAFTTQYGKEVAQGQGASVPLPPAVTIGMIMLGIGILFSLYRSMLQVPVKC